MRKKPITLKSFLTKYVWMFDNERELVIELLKGTKYYDKEEEEELKKYDSLVARNIVEIKKDLLWYYLVSLKEYE